MVVGEREQERAVSRDETNRKFSSTRIDRDAEDTHPNCNNITNIPNLRASLLAPLLITSNEDINSAANTRRLHDIRVSMAICLVVMRGI